MIYGLIISAGNQSRFDSDIPKALMKYKDSTLLDLNIENMLTSCDKVIVVCSHENCKWFSIYPHIQINSGLGCGDAVLKALLTLNLTDDDTVFIQWGDCLHKTNVYTVVKNAYKSHCVIPCVYEDLPYVQIIPQVDKHVLVKFSKYGDKITSGLHDLSLFYGNAKNILKHLQEFQQQILVNGKYIHKHGNEMQFLDVFNETNITADVIELSDYEVFSFNTIDEFKSITNTKVDNS